MKVVIHYEDGSTYTHTGCQIEAAYVNWEDNYAILTCYTKKHIGEFEIDLEGVLYLEDIDVTTGEYFIFYRPVTKEYGQPQNLSVKVDVMTAKQRRKANMGGGDYD